jgi:hypothetical protein
VVRGGSFNNNDHNARAANRNDNDPDNRNNNIGFRVVVSTFFFAPEAPAGTVACRPRRRMAGSAPGRVHTCWDRANNNGLAPWATALARGHL